jgi:hypothetical protein
MYDVLDTRELTALQSILFEAAEDAYRTAHLTQDDPDWLGHYHPVHQEIAHLFIEAATALLERLDQHVLVA